MPSEKRRQDDQWHIKKTFDLSHMATTAALVFSAFWFFATLDKRISMVEMRADDRDQAFQEFRMDIKEIKKLLWDMKPSDD